MERFRQGIVAVITDSEGRVLLGERSDTPGTWQFPQGGLEPGESAEKAFYREVAEELGNRNCVILRTGATRTQYRWPEPGFDCVGQEQTWFLGRFLPGQSPDLDKSDGCFRNWKWEVPRLAISQIVDWKRDAFTFGLEQLGILPVGNLVPVERRETEILRTPRLVLRTWSLADLPDGLAIWGDPEVMKYVDSGKALSENQVRESIEAGIRHQESYGHQHWAVIERETNRLIGACGFNRAEEPGVLELVFHFAKEFWGRGYASEAARACVDFAMARLKPAKIIAGCHPENEASQKVLLKAGLIFVGNKWFEDTQRDEPCFELVP